MQESFLHFVWQYQYFNKQELRTTGGQLLQVLDPGISNVDAGPDFWQSRILLDHLQWAGLVEVHIKSSQWLQHKHHLDSAYSDIILHVVWADNQPIKRSDGSFVPTLELQGRIPTKMLLNQQKLLAQRTTFGCQGQFKPKHHHHLEVMMERALKQRLQVKEQRVLKILKQVNYDWDTTVYRVLGRNFGFKINADAFEDLVKAVPLAVAKRLSQRLHQLEALYFGQAGLLEALSSDRYYCRLQKEYQYLQSMFPSLPKPMKAHRWKYLRMRPRNFPTLRIAQFALLIHHHGYRFSQYREMQDERDLLAILNGESSDYWQIHYQFGKITPKKSSKLGQSSMHNIAINTVAPLMLAYHNYLGLEDHYAWAKSFLKTLPNEQNTVTRYWKESGFKVTSAFHSQALLALKENYCQVKKCLKCSIGLSLVKGIVP